MQYEYRTAVPRARGDEPHLTSLKKEPDTPVPRARGDEPRCHACGHIADSMSLSVRVWQCVECGKQHDRDINAAKNILKAGKAILAGADKLREHEKTTVGHTGG